jgi:hypothetical protein
LSFGSDDFDMLANDWDIVELVEWGMEIPSLGIEEVEEDEDNTKSEKSKCPTCGQGIDKDTPF